MQDFGVTASNLVTHIIELVQVSDERHIRLSDMDKYIDEMISKNKQLEKESQELNDKISTVRKQTSEIENLQDLALEQKRAAELEMKSYTNAKQELNRYDIPISEDLPVLFRDTQIVLKY
jgi:TolA-binding protein